MPTPKNNSVVKAFEILNLLFASNKPLSALEIAALVGLNISTTHRFLLTLEDVGALTRSFGNRYRLGITIAELSRRVTEKDILADRARVHIEQLSEKLQETVALATFDGKKISLLSWSEPSRFFAFHLRRDITIPLHCSAFGKVFIAGLPGFEVEKLMKHITFEQYTKNTITDMVSLRREVRQVAKTGFAQDKQEMEKGLDCLAIPIKNPSQKTVSALCIFAPSSRMNPQAEETFKKELSHHAMLIQQALFVQSKTLQTKAKPKGAFPHMKRVDRFVFLSGMSSRRPDETFVGVTKKKSGKVAFDIRAQAKATFSNINDVMASIGYSLADLVSFEAFLTDEKYCAGFSKVCKEVFNTDTRPVQTITIVQSLPHPHQLLMVKAIGYT